MRLVPTLRAVARRPLLLGCGCVPIVLVIVVVLALLLGRSCRSEDSRAGERTTNAAVEAAGPRALLNRLWFDRMPTAPKDTLDLWIFLAGGIGIHEHGSSYRASFDLFEFERQGARLGGKFLHDGAPLKTDFTVRACDHEGFDLCLVLDSVGGKRVELYGFGSEEDMDRAIPGARAVLAAARARAQP